MASTLVKGWTLTSHDFNLDHIFGLQCSFSQSTLINFFLLISHLSSSVWKCQKCKSHSQTRIPYLFYLLVLLGYLYTFFSYLALLFRNCQCWPSLRHSSSDMPSRLSLSTIKQEKKIQRITLLFLYLSQRLTKAVSCRDIYFLHHSTPNASPSLSSASFCLSLCLSLSLSLSLSRMTTTADPGALNTDWLNKFLLIAHYFHLQSTQWGSYLNKSLLVFNVIPQRQMQMFSTRYWFFFCVYYIIFVPC